MPQHEGLSGLIATMATLRSPGGCPWDLEQTHESLVPYLLEEVFELIEALEAGTRADVKEELGDVLYQLLFHADIASADPLDPFDIDEIAQLVDQGILVAGEQKWMVVDKKLNGKVVAKISILD